MKRFLLVLTLSLLIPLTALAATTPIDFSGFTGSGLSPQATNGRLDSEIWRITGLSDGDGMFGGSYMSGDFARGRHQGGVVTGGLYAFDKGSGNIILGIQPTGSDFTPGTITLKVRNERAYPITAVTISYEVWYYNDQPRANALHFAYSLDDMTYTPVPALDFVTPASADASPAWQVVTRTITINDINLPANGILYLQWQGDDVSGSGSRDEYGIDNIEVRAMSPTAITLFSLDALPQRRTGSLPLLLPMFLAFMGGCLIRSDRTECDA